MKLLVTGANGFVGAAAVDYLSEQNHEVLAHTRRGIASPNATQPATQVQHVQHVRGAYEQLASWSDQLVGCDAVLHTAARVHQMHEASLDPMLDYRRVNVAHTLALAQAAALAGVARFVFLSSVKVNGNYTLKNHPYTAHDAPNPADPYGISKHEAEQGLMDIAAQTGMQVVIIRPPLIYGPGAKANFLSMMRWLQRGVPLPLGAIHNQRSLLGIRNLLDVINVCLTHPRAANQIFLASDGQDVSTTELLQLMGQALDKPARLVKVPQSWLELGAKALGKPGIAQRLCGNLAVDINKTRELLEWQPPVSLEAGLRETAAHFLQSQR